MTTPPTGQQPTTAEIRLAQYGDHSTWSNATYSSSGEKTLHEIALGLKAQIDRLRTALTAIQHLHKDSPMGPCPVCIDADAVAAGGDGLMPYPCPTGRLAGAQDCDPPHVRAAWYTAAGDEMAASLVRDGFGDDEIADMARRAAVPAGGE